MSKISMSNTINVYYVHLLRTENRCLVLVNVN